MSNIEQSHSVSNDSTGAETHESNLSPWHLKKDINISLIIGMILQAAVAVWWVSDFNAWRHQTDDHLERVDKILDETTHRADAVDRELADRLGRIETTLANIESRLDERRGR